jgi:streptogramin lyase
MPRRPLSLLPGLNRRRFRLLARRYALAALFALCALASFQVSAQAQIIVEFPTIAGGVISTGGFPLGIVVGPDGNLWFIQRDGRVGQMTPAGVPTVFSAGISGISVPSESSSIAAGPDGNLWFTEGSVDKIGVITMTGAVTEYSITQGAQPAGIVAGPDGNLWFTESDRDSIGRITPLGTVTEFSAGITKGSTPVGITAGPDGNLWFTEIRGKIGRITPQGMVTEFGNGLVNGQLPDAITAGPDGNMWFTDIGLNLIGRVTTAGAITLFSAGISPGAQPNGITTGPDGNLWFTESGTSKIARITTGGAVTEYSVGITPNSQPYGIVSGPGGYLWFTEYATAQIGRSGAGVLNIQNGYWWNPSAYGRGYVIEQRGSNLFAGLFLYDPSGRATWYGVGPGPVNGTSYTGTLSSYANGQTLTGAYRSATLVGPAGNISIAFSSPTQATVVSPGGTEQIQRYYFGPADASTDPQPGFPETGWWWAPTEGGRGYAIEVQGGMLFLSGYMYDTAGNPIWYDSQGAMLVRTAYSGVWQQLGFGQSLGGGYVTPTTVNANVGSISIQFTSTTTGVLTLPDGRQIAIQRYTF